VKKKIIISILLVILALGAIIPAVGGAEDLVLKSLDPVVDFPMGITFSASAQSPADIVDMRLHYMVERQGFARIVSEIKPSFTASRSVTASWTWDMRMTGGMPPGTSIDYWWTAVDADGAEQETLPGNLVLQDNRYDWESITEGMVTLYWYSGGDDFAGELMDATQDALTRLSDTAGAELEEPVSLYIYKDSAALRGALIFAQEWTGGVAFTQYGVVAIGIGTSASELEWGKRTIAHELTHLVTAQVVANPYGDMPTWLSEGLSMYAEGDLQSTFTNVFGTALRDGSLISVRSLASPFSTDDFNAYLSYAESYYLVDYLISRYGRDKMLELLDTLSEGTTYDNALLQVYGFDMDGLNTEWQAYVETAVS